SPNRVRITSFDFGPWTWTGWTSGSRTVTSRPLWMATPRAHRPASESARASHQRFSSTRSRTGSLTMPPSSAVIRTYLPWPTAHLVSARHVRELADRALGQVAARERVRERRGVRPDDLDDPLHPDVPERHAVQQRPVLLDRVAVVAREVHVVVDVVRAGARLQRLLEERRAAVPRAEVEGRGGRALGGDPHRRRHRAAISRARARRAPSS